MKPGNGADCPGVQSVLLEEIDRLPRFVCTAVVLGDLEGRSPEVAARRFRWALRKREQSLTMVRAILRSSMARRSLLASGSLWAARYANDDGSIVPRRLIEATVKAAIRHRRIDPRPAGLVRPCSRGEN